MNSFHDSVKAKIPAERMPGTAIGKMILTIAPKRVAPSIRAHSSSSLGIVLKYPMRSHVQNGIRNVGYVRISADRKSTRLNSSHITISYAVFCLKKKIRTKTDNHMLSTPKDSTA